MNSFRISLHQGYVSNRVPLSISTDVIEQINGRSQSPWLLFKSLKEINAFMKQGCNKLVKSDSKNIYVTVDFCNKL